MNTHTSLSKRNPATRPAWWFPPAPARDEQPIVVVTTTAAPQPRDDSEQLRAELAAARAEILQLHTEREASHAQICQLLQEQKTDRMEIRQLRTERTASLEEIRQLRASLGYYRARAAKPMVEHTRETWLSRALCGKRDANPMPVLTTLTQDVYDLTKVATLPELRA
jgi:septal ring factor EnvC (AmiA/AmiB activator)